MTDEPQVIDVEENPYTEDPNLAPEPAPNIEPDPDPDHEPEAEPAGDGDEEAGPDEPAPILGNLVDKLPGQ